MKQISMFDCPELIGKALYSAKLCPVRFAEANGTQTERTWDGLDFFDFIAFESDGAVVALRKHQGNRTEWCYVTLENYFGSNPTSFLANSLGLTESDIVQLDEHW